MPTSKKAIREFMNQKRDDFTKLKRVPHEKLDQELAKLDPEPHFYTSPMWHQKCMLLASWHRPRFIHSAVAGAGKTYVMLNAIKQRKRAGLPHRALVLVPRVSHLDIWKNEVQKHTPELTSLTLDDSQLCWKYLEEDGGNADVVVINYPRLVAMLSELEQSKKKNKNKEYKVKNSRIHQLSQYVDGLILDEIQNVGNHQSKQFKAVDKISSISHFAYGLTGTLIGRDPTRLWPIFYVIDRGESLGSTLSFFRELFFTQRKNYAGYWEWHFLKSKSNELAELLKHRSLRFNEDELEDLPEQTFQRVTVPIPPQAEEYYEQTRKELFEEKGKNYEATKNSFIRLRQIASGFLSVKNEEDDDRIQIEFPQKPKIDAAIALAMDIPNSHKVIMFHEFILTGRFLSQALDKEKVDYEWVYGGSRDPQGQIRRFQEDENCRILVVNTRMGSEGLNLQMANHAVFIESPVAPDVRFQAEKRIRRHGQKHDRCVYYDIVCQNSVDEKILSYIAEGEDLANRLINSPASVKEI